jgi:gluconokinase
LAQIMAGVFLEGDDYHPAANIAKMASGHALTDEDRWPWLERLAAAIRDCAPANGAVVASCSALKRAYRDRLRSALARPVCFVCLTAGHASLERRLKQRAGHYMPASLLQSQLDTLELPQPDEDAIVVSAEQAPADLLQSILERLDVRR